jgi:hypothetical protein
VNRIRSPLLSRNITVFLIVSIFGFSAMEGTFHRRKLPPPAVSFSSDAGKALFQLALAQGTMNVYFRLAENYCTQGHPSFCSLGSLTMALNALLIDPRRIWQGVWRWFDESMLDCCQGIEVTKLQGMTLAKVACLARCNAADVQLYYGPDRSVEEFRADILASVSSTQPLQVMIVSYNRRTLGQSGSGHYSPIGGYEPKEDMVLVLDVARFKYPPHWVPLSLLYNALQDLDSDSGKPRGYLLLQATTRMYEQCACGNKNEEEEEEDIEKEVSTIIADTDTTTITSATNTTDAAATIVAVTVSSTTIENTQSEIHHQQQQEEEENIQKKLNEMHHHSCSHCCR